jgi:hypothetical protein
MGYVNHSDKIAFINLAYQSPHLLQEYVQGLPREYAWRLIIELYNTFKEDKIMSLALLNAISSYKAITDLELLLIPVELWYFNDAEVKESALNCFETWNDKPSLFFLYQLNPDKDSRLEEKRKSIVNNLEKLLYL